MMETNDGVLEEKGTGDGSENSAPEKDTSDDNANTDEEELDEQGKPKPKPKADEESLEDKIERIAQSKSDISMKTYQRRLESLQTENDALKDTRTSSIMDARMARLAGEYQSDEGITEAEARKRVVEDKEASELIKTFAKDNAYVTRMKPILEQLESRLQTAERNQGVREKLWLLNFPESKSQLDTMKAQFKKFDKARDWDEVEVLFEGIEAVAKSKGSKFAPASNKGTQVKAGEQSQDELLREMYPTMYPKK